MDMFLLILFISVHVWHAPSLPTGSEILVPDLLWEIFICHLKLNLMTSSSFPQPAFTCSKLTIETQEQGVKYVQS